MSETVGQELVGKTHTRAMMEPPLLPAESRAVDKMHHSGRLRVINWRWKLRLVISDGPHREPTIIADFPSDMPVVRANAARLVACWNACAGISTAALEGGLIGRLIDTLATSPVVCAGLVQAMNAAELSKRPYADRANIIQGENDCRDQT